MGANVYVPALKAGTTTNTYVFYSLALPAGKTAIYYSFVGYAPDSLIIDGKKPV
ncbi:MAG: hypothetical protein Q7K43_01555, partial [Candidatus Woesearchaeota archaeon]|nr:hypothetical protein [Candidatus Woesearchaeota archaeon]